MLTCSLLAKASPDSLSERAAQIPKDVSECDGWNECAVKLMSPDCTDMFWAGQHTPWHLLFRENQVDILSLNFTGYVKALTQVKLYRSMHAKMYTVCIHVFFNDACAVIGVQECLCVVRRTEGPHNFTKSGPRD